MYARPITLSKGTKYPIFNFDVKNLADPKAKPCLFIEDLNSLLIEEDRKWKIMVGINSKPPQGDITIAIKVLNKYGDDNASKNMFRTTKTAHNYPQRSSVEKCIKCGDKALWLALCYDSGKSTRSKIMPLCLDCTKKGELIINDKRGKTRQCRICHSTMPDLHIHTIKQDILHNYHLQIHTACIEKIFDLPELEEPTWKEFQYKVIIIEGNE